MSISQFGVGVFSISQFAVAGYALAQFGVAWTLLAQVGVYFHEGRGQLVVHLSRLLGFQ